MKLNKLNIYTIVVILLILGSGVLCDILEYNEDNKNKIKESKSPNNSYNGSIELNKNENIDIIEKFPEFLNINSQKILMVSPAEQCKCHQRTIFFRYPSDLEQNIKNFNITELTIQNREYFVGAFEQYFGKINYTMPSISNTLSNNNIIRLHHMENANLIWTLNNSIQKKKTYNLNYYQRQNTILRHYEITRKDNLYINYEKMNKKFSNDFTYMPKTYVKINTNEFEKEFENYTLSENNLWLIKPKLLSRGRGIHFLKNVENIKKNDIVMKYISNPLLIDNRKFDIRLYLLVTGHDPLKIYLFKEGLCRLSTDEFDLNIKDLDNTYKHLTNTSINKNNKKGYKYNDFVKSISELKKLIEEKYNTNFNKIWDQIKDICVDVIIDDKFKVWLLEVNHGPDLNVSKYKSHRTNIKYQIVHDMFNIIGMVPFSHVNGHALEGKCIYENSIEEIIDQSICELTRPLGGFEVIFPLKENINYYKKFFESYSENNKVLWNRINKENGKKKKKIVNNSTVNVKSIDVIKSINLGNENKEKKKIEKKKINGILEKSEKKKNILEKIPQYTNVTSQKLLMLLPSSKCKVNQRTIFFKYPSLLKSNINDRVEEFIINDKKYFVGGKHPNLKSLRSTLSENGIISLFEENNVNLNWRATRKNSVIPLTINKYQKYNHMLMFHEITRKHLLYKNYEIFKKQFSEDFNYLPKTYTQETIEEFKRYFKNYKISKNNLWLIKPRNSSLGNKIRFLKSVNDVRKNEIVTKYISNPLLINGKKFDLRFHVLVTGHNPLKIYVHSNGWAKVSSEKYDIDLDQLDNIFKHVTNLYLNKKNKNNFKVKESVVSFEKIKKYLKKEYKLNFSEIEKKVNDIIIKSIITMNHLEIKKENSMKLKSNNIYDLYGVDIMIDENFKPWLIEININPTLAEESLTLDRKKMLRQTLVDLFNIIGIVPYSHIDGKALEGEKKFKNYIEEAIQQSICEFTRPLGGFKRIFPLKSNIEIYKKYFKEISPINKYLWDTINNNLY